MNLTTTEKYEVMPRSEAPMALTIALMSALSHGSMSSM